MQASPVVALALEGVDAVQVVRTMTGSTNGREAAPGTIRGDYSISNQQNIVHASDSTSNAEIELKRFFRDEEIFEYTKQCRFSDCTHTHEPGCAVLKAVEEHLIAPSRYQSYLSMLDDKDENKYREAY